MTERKPLTDAKKLALMRPLIMKQVDFHAKKQAPEPFYLPPGLSRLWEIIDAPTVKE